MSDPRLPYSAPGRVPLNCAIPAATRRSRILVLLLLWPILVALTPEECATIGRAHERLLESSFEVERTFSMSVNGNLKKREVARLTYSAGELATEVVEDEVLSKVMVFESDGKDFVLEIRFACDRLEGTGEGLYELASEDGLEVAEFELEDATGALRPVAWRLDTTERFLFRKLVMAGRAQYSGFEWKPGQKD